MSFKSNGSYPAGCTVSAWRSKDYRGLWSVTDSANSITDDVASAHYYRRLSYSCCCCCCCRRT